MPTPLRSARPEGLAFTPEPRPLNRRVAGNYIKKNKAGKDIHCVLYSDMRRNEIQKNRKFADAGKVLSLEEFMMDKLLEQTLND